MTVHSERRDRVRAALRDRGIDAAYVSRLVNVRYLTGFTGSNGAALVRADGDAILATDGRYKDQAVVEAPDVGLDITRDLGSSLLARCGGQKVGVETHDLSVDAYELLRAGSGAVKFHPLDRLIERLREIKDETEIESLRRACSISTLALEELLAGPIAGRSERDLARDLERRMFGLGADAIAFDTILASGPNSAIPHHAPGDRIAQKGDFLKIDFGARIDGYHADCTRTVALGRAADWQREIYAAVQSAQAGGLDDLREGTPVSTSRLTVDRILGDSGWLDAFTTGLGHGVGLEIHEDPFISTEHPGKLASCTALTMEPGIYLPGRGGVRIEDTAVVGASPEVLTTMTKDLLELA